MLREALRWGETLLSPICRRRRREPCEHLRRSSALSSGDAPFDRLAALDMGLNRVPRHHDAIRKTASLLRAVQHLLFRLETREIFPLLTSCGVRDVIAVRRTNN